ncbi:Ribosome-associated heat shock protein implicated in the recycling of the 50S subunit (S4 paralog) [hydrothermal vent metagenome]|uniref:Ribosome-associated heat shock protein implicated in the recycling of the 50S subunit (S4 paralog) n=1 Tax=hydrothermal vent metagenome TaxID=652676 RepID=A0A3B0U8Z6_9ZZZZ
MSYVRLDKWLWAVRLYKTRSQATEACKGGKVKIAGSNAKPSREVNEGDEMEIHSGGIIKKIRVKKAVKNRVSASLVPDLMEDLTPAEELEKRQMMRQLNYEKRTRGAGRPTKKDRRIIDKLKGKPD